MLLSVAREETEVRTEFRVQRLRRVSPRLQPAAARRAVIREGGDKHYAARLHCTSHLRDVLFPICLRCEEVKDGPVMPDVEAFPGERCGEYIGFAPVHTRRGNWAQAMARVVEGSRRKVEHRYVSVARAKKSVHEC